MNKPSVLVVHNRYQERGGEDSVFEAETALLESYGHRVGRLVFDNHDIPSRPSPVQKLGLAVQTVWSFKGRERLRQAVETFRPDVVHFHNTLPQVSPAAYEVCRQAGAVVVQTLHNFRIACANGMFYRDGRPCEDCLGRTVALPALVHACYRDSRTQTAAVVAMQAVHRARGTWRRDVDVYIAPSAFLRDKLVAGGLPAERVVVKPNFVDPDPGQGSGDGGYALFAGRLTPTKGVETLLDAYRKRVDLPPLHIAGDGELAPAVLYAAAADSRIIYRGWLDRDGVLDEMGRAACLVFPSRWYENFPVTIAEAFSRGLPVVGSRIGAVADLIEDGYTGRLFRAGSATDLAGELASLMADAPSRRQLARNARLEYESKYTGARNYEGLMAAYGQALGRAVTPALATAGAPAS